MFSKNQQIYYHEKFEYKMSKINRGCVSTKYLDLYSLWLLLA